MGICLKRYMMTESGMPKRQNTFIDIPDSLRLPRFMMLDDARINESSELNAEYKLVLQSVVCHRGDSLHSGHYISFARVNPKLLTDNRMTDVDPPPDYEEAQWVKFDDLQTESRVTYVDDIKQSLKDEMPYLLFYQIVPMVDVNTSSSEEVETEPPSYTDLRAIVASGQTPNLDVEQSDISRETSGYFDSTTWTNGTGPSIRFSSEMERPSRISLDEESNASAIHLKADASRRGSVAFTESTVATPAVTPDGVSPAITPNEESAAQRLSRAAAIFTKSSSRSRPASQTGENRISLTMSRLGLMRTSKEPLRGADSGSETAVEQPPPPSSSEHSANENNHQHHHHHHNHLKREKDRSKSKGRSGDKEKEKEGSGDKGRGGKENGKQKAGGVPERECLVM